MHTCTLKSIYQIQFVTENLKRRVVLFFLKTTTEQAERGYSEARRTKDDGIPFPKL